MVPVKLALVRMREGRNLERSKAADRPFFNCVAAVRSCAQRSAL